MQKVEGHTGLYKKGNAVVNTDYSAFLRAKERKKEKQKVNELENRLNRIEELLERLIDVHKA
jgi:hypothetical protein